MLRKSVDRTEPPEIRSVDRLTIQPAEKMTLGNGMPLYVINQGSQDVCSIGINFKAGKWQQPQKLVAYFTNRLMREGTVNYTANELAEKIDYYGAIVKTQSGTDRATLQLITLNKYVAELLPVFAEIVRQPVFPESELEIALTNGKERLKVNKTKPDFIASRKFSAALFGDKHPYGSEQRVEDYQTITPNVLHDFYAAHYTSSNGYMLLAGKINSEMIQLAEKYFGDKDWLKPLPAEPAWNTEPSSSFKQRVKMENTYQSALRIGKRLFNKTHPDFQKMQVLNTVFGGYFGSRLMSNIREDKGFTYGIHSSLSSLVNDGYFLIGTEVGYDVRKKALKEIYFEINRLREEIIPEDEIELVRNYLTGKILSGLDGAFKIADYYDGLLIYNLDIDFVHRLLNTIKTVTPHELRELAVKYWNPDEMYEVVTE